MATDPQLFRSCVLEVLPKSGRKIWCSLYLDFQFIQLGIKRSLLFDYADVSFEDLISLVRKIKSTCIVEPIGDELVVMKAGESCFILHSNKFLQYLGDVEEIYFNDSTFQSTKRRGIIADISTSISGPMELKSMDEKDELRRIIEEAKNKLLLLGSRPSSHIVLSDAKEIPWCTIFGIFLNYPCVYWFKTENSNLVGESLINYHIKLNEKAAFGIEIPHNYSILSFTVPETLITLHGEDFVLQWYTSLRRILCCSSGPCATIFLHQVKANGFQTSL